MVANERLDLAFDATKVEKHRARLLLTAVEDVSGGVVVSGEGRYSVVEAICWLEREVASSPYSEGVQFLVEELREAVESGAEEEKLLEIVDAIEEVLDAWVFWGGE